MGFAEGGVVVNEDDDEWEPVKLITGQCDSDSGTNKTLLRTWCQ